MAKRNNEFYNICNLKELINTIFEDTYEIKSTPCDFINNKFSYQICDESGDSLCSKYKMDIIKNNNVTKLTIELPGVEREDISVEYNDNILKVIINSNEDTTNNEDSCRYHKRSSYTGIITRQFDNVNKETIDATLKNGVLTIQFETLEEKSNQGIKIEIK